MSSFIEAASVLLGRGPGSSEVLVVRRAASLRFFGGFFAFPGGKVTSEDVRLLPAQPRIAAAVRELFEETGVLLARRADGSFPASSPELDHARQEVGADRLAFGPWLQESGLAIRAEDLLLIGDLVTPPFSSYRFDTSFFAATLPPGQEPKILTGELEEGRWATAQALLDEWTAGRCLVTPPTLVLLEALQGHGVLDLPQRLAPTLAAIDAGAFHTILWAPQVRHIPLLTVALPPSTHTNAYLIGREPAYLLDPGADDPAEQQRLFDCLDGLRQQGTRLAAILLSHHHPDHVGAAGVCARRYGVQIRAHPETARALAGKLAVEGDLQEGSVLDLGPAPDGSGSWHLETLLTPGHAVGHLVFFEPHYRLLFVGDMISTASSVVIGPPPDGNLVEYLHSLRRLRDIDCRILLPAHGVATVRPRKVIEDAIAHREERERQLLTLLRERPRRLAELAMEIYRGVPAQLMRFAQYQVLAGLGKLQAEGRVREDAQGEERVWRLVEE